MSIVDHPSRRGRLNFYIKKILGKRSNSNIRNLDIEKTKSTGRSWFMWEREAQREIMFSDGLIEG